MAYKDNGAINGVDDSTQSVYKPKPAAAPAQVAPSTPQRFLSGDAAASVTRPPSIFKNGTQPTGPTGEYLPITEETQRQARTGGGTFDPAATSQLPDFNPVTSALDRAARPTVQPPTVASSAPPPAAAAPALGAPGQAAAMLTASAPAAAVAMPSFDNVAAGYKPRLVDDSNIAAVVKNPNATAYAAPGTNNDAAIANTLARTPTFQQGADQIARNQATLAKDTGFNMDPAYMAQQQAKSDLLSIAAKDPRSVAGIAARNAEVDAGSTFGTRDSRAIAYNNTLKGLVDQASAPEAAAALNAKESGDTQRVAMTQAGDTQRNAATNAANMFDSQLRRPVPNQIQLADGTLGLLGADGVVRPAVGTDGKPITPAQPRDPENKADFAKLADARARIALGIDPTDNLIHDPKDPKNTRAPTMQELNGATKAAYETLERQNKQGTAPTPTKAEWMAAARAKNPGVAQSDLEKFYNTRQGS